MASAQTTPEVTWAQRSSDIEPEKNYIYLTISTPDVSKQSTKIDLKPTSLTFTGHSDTKKTTYHVALEFYAEIDVDNSITHHSARDIEFVLRKKELKEEYWPRLLKESKKVHFLKTNFDKWVDQDEQDAAPEGDDAMNNFGGGGGMPGMGGMGGEDGGFGGIDFSKLGGMGGAGGMPGMEGLGDLGGEGGEDEDEDMPELEDEEGVEKVETGKEVEEVPEAKITETGASATKTTPKIEEIS